MKVKRTIIAFIAPERVSLRVRFGLKKKLKSALNNFSINVSEADAFAAPAWLAKTVAAVIPNTKIKPEAVDDCDFLVALWDGLQKPEDPIYRRISDFTKTHQSNCLICIPIDSGRKLNAENNTNIGTFIDRNKYKYGIFLSSCQADEKLASEIKRRLKGTSVPSSIAKRVGKGRIKPIYNCVGDVLTDDDRNGLSNARAVVLVCSPANEKGGKNREVTKAFSKIRGRKHIHAALAAGEPKEAFPPALLKDERYIDPQTGEEVHVGESLAANFKVENKKQYTRETIRLLAPILGCGFDDLFRRHAQQFRDKLIRLLAAASVIPLVFFVISMWEVHTGAMMKASEQRTAQQEAVERQNAEDARLKVQEAEDQNKEARYAEAVRLTHEAILAMQSGNSFEALHNLIAATPERGIIRELPKESESLMREIMGMGQIIPLIRLHDAQNPFVEDNTLYCLTVDGELVEYDLITGKGPVAARQPISDFESKVKNEGSSFNTGSGTVTFKSDGTATIYDDKGIYVDSLIAHQSAPIGAFWAREGKLIVSYCANEVVLWGVIGNNSRRSIQAHAGAINDLWLGENILATAGKDGIASIWNYDGKLVLTLQAGYPLSTVEAREGADRVVTCGANGKVALWELSSGEKLWETTVANAGSARLSPDGKSVVAGYRRIPPYFWTPDEKKATAALINAKDGTVVKYFPNDGIPWYGEIFESNVFVSHDGRTPKLRDANTSKIRFEYTLIHDGGNPILSPFGDVYLTGGELHFDHLGKRYLEGIYGVSGRTMFEFPSPAEQGVFLDVGEENCVMINFTDEAVTRSSAYEYVSAHSYHHSDSVVCAAFSPDGVYAVTASLDGTAAVLNKEGLAWLIHADAPVIESGFSPDGSKVILACGHGRLMFLPMGNFDDMRERAKELINP